MDNYDWLGIYGNLNSDFSTREALPVIGITGNYNQETCTLAEGYYQSVLKAGGIPFIIPPFYLHLKTFSSPSVLNYIAVCLNRQ